MSETTWSSAIVDAPSRTTARTLGQIWKGWVSAPLHRALDAGLRAGELRTLDARTLADIGYRRG